MGDPLEWGSSTMEGVVAWCLALQRARGAEGLAGAPWAAQRLSPGLAGRAGSAVQDRWVSRGRCAWGCVGCAAQFEVKTLRVSRWGSCRPGNWY